MDFGAEMSLVEVEVEALSAIPNRDQTLVGNRNLRHAQTFFLSLSQSSKQNHTPNPHTLRLISTMTTAEIDTKKRKRKHKSKRDEEVAPAETPSSGVAAVEKPRKKSKKVHTPEPEVEEAVAELSEDQGKDPVENEEDQLNEELKSVAADGNGAEVDDAAMEDEQDDAANGANMEPLGLPSGTSMPTMDDPQRFDELNLSERTMEAIKTMGFETMTEIQRKAIPPLLRYAIYK